MNKALTHGFTLNSRPDNDIRTLFARLGYDVIDVLQCIVMKLAKDDPGWMLDAVIWCVCGVNCTAALRISLVLATLACKPGTGD